METVNVYIRHVLEQSHVLEEHCSHELYKL